MITNIRKRQLELNRIRESSNQYAAMYNIVLENHNLTQANTVFDHILELDSNIDTSIMKSVDLLLELYETNNPADVNRYRQKVLESISKVRDASEFRNHIQRKMALHKGRVQNKINNAIDSATDKVKQHAEELKKKVGSTSSQEDNKEKENEAKKETMEMIYKVACENVAYDRIIRNYNKISKRFDFDKIVIEKILSKQDAIREAYTVSKLIDTYNINDIDKFKITTENYLFVLDKNACPYDAVSVIEAVADYFLVNGSNKMVYVESLEKTLKDMANYNPLNSSDISKIMDAVELSINDPAKEDEFLAIDTLSGKVDKYIAKFKFNPELKNFEIMLADIIHNVGAEEYIIHIGSIIEVLNSVNKTTTEYFNKLIDFTDMVISTYNGTESGKIKIITNVINTYIKYRSRIDGSIDIDEVINRLRLATSINESFDNMDPYAVDAKLDLMMDPLHNITLGHHNINTLIKETVDKFTLTDFDEITAAATRYNSTIDRERLIDIFKDQLKECRKNPHKSFDDYVKIDCIKDNISKLKNFEVEDRELSLDEAIAVTKENEMLAAFISDFKNYPHIFTEMNIANTIAMASEKIKAKISDIDKSIVNMGRQFDAGLDQLKKVLDTPELESENREAVISGNILPKASRIIKLAITSGAAALINPALSVVVVLGYLGSTLEARSKERRKVLEEIEVELEMTKRYLKKAEDDGHLEKQRELLKIKKKLESQKARLTYNMLFKHGDAVHNKEKDDD